MAVASPMHCGIIITVKVKEFPRGCSNPLPTLGLGMLLFREVCKKSKWKFKMTFAMKGGGLECHTPILKNVFF